MSADVKSSPTPEKRMRISETRQLRLSLDGLLEALLALDRQKNGWVWRGLRSHDQRGRCCGWIGRGRGAPRCCCDAPAG